MINPLTADTLRRMRCSAMAVELEKQLSDPNTYNSLSFNAAREGGSDE